MARPSADADASATPRHDASVRKYRLVLASCLFAGFATYSLLRKTLTFTMPTLMRDLGLVETELGSLASSFSIAYGVSKFVAGMLCDRLSASTLFVSGLLASAALNMAFGACSTTGAFLALWTVNGLVQGFGWPPVAKLIKTWFPTEERATWWGIVSMSSNMATSLSPFVVNMLVETYGWRATFYAHGAFAVLAAAAIASCVSDKPPSNSSSTSASCSSSAAAPSGASAGAAVPANAESAEGARDRVDEGVWRFVFSTPMLWVVCITYALVNFIIAGFAWGQLYLMSKGQSESAAGKAMGSFELGGILGTLLIGYVSDRLLASRKQSEHERKGADSGQDVRGAVSRLPVLLVCSLFVGAFLHFMRSADTAHSDQYFFAIGFVLYGPKTLFGVMAVELSPPRFSGTSHAVAGLIAQAGGIVAGLPLSAVAKAYGWDTAFLVLEAAAVLTAVICALVCSLRRDEGKEHSD